MSEKSEREYKQIPSRRTVKEQLDKLDWGALIRLGWVGEMLVAIDIKNEMRALADKLQKGAVEAVEEAARAGEGREDFWCGVLNARVAAARIRVWREMEEGLVALVNDRFGLPRLQEVSNGWLLREVRDRIVAEMKKRGEAYDEQKSGRED